MLSRIRIGQNFIGYTVLFCEICKETFQIKVQDKTVEEVIVLAAKHECDPAKSLRNAEKS